MATDKIIKIPDIGGAVDVDVIEVMVKPGDTIELDTPLITLESDKASMEIPSTAAGVVKSVTVKLGDKVSEGDVILNLIGAENADTQTKAPSTTKEIKTAEVAPESHSVAANPTMPSSNRRLEEEEGASPFAGPGVRRLARVLEINLHDVVGTGLKSRITSDDLEAYIKNKLQNGSQGSSSLSIPTAPEIDFSQFGEIDYVSLNKIKRLTGAQVYRSYVSIPQVTQFDEADITSLEEFRKIHAVVSTEPAVKLTILAFVCKVVSKALAVFPQFNASLDSKGEQLIYKKYCNIGIAVETPNGLVVPVIQGVDKLSLTEIATEMARLSTKAREKGLMPGDMRGSCFTISSLGGISGTAFTPIVNSPEVAILGLSRSTLKPIYDGEQWVPRLMLPLSLSYDHRVIDGAEGARFTKFISEMLSDIRRILL